MFTSVKCPMSSKRSGVKRANTAYATILKYELNFPRIMFVYRIEVRSLGDFIHRHGNFQMKV